MVQLKDYLNNPKRFCEALGTTVEEFINSKNDAFHLCHANNFGFANEFQCYELICNNCPFCVSIEKAIEWLKSE